MSEAQQHTDSYRLRLKLRLYTLNIHLSAFKSKKDICYVKKKFHKHCSPFSLLYLIK